MSSRDWISLSCTMAYLAVAFITIGITEKWRKGHGLSDNDSSVIVATVGFAWPIAILVILLRASGLAMLDFLWYVFSPTTDPPRDGEQTDG